MKTFALITLFVGYAVSQVTAQSVYSSNDFASVGDTIYMTSAQIVPVDFDTTGANVTWNYGSLTGISQRQIIFRSPAQTGVVWPFIYNSSNTNLSSTDNVSLSLGELQLTNPNDFYLKNTSSLRQTASTSVLTLGNIPYTLKNQYSTPDLLLSFPISYGNIDSSYSGYTTTIPNLLFRQTSIKRINNVSGWGTVITPYGVFSNCLKIESQVMQIDSISIDTLPSIIDTTYYREFRWMDFSKKYDILHVRQTLIGNNYVTQSIDFFDNQQYFQPTALFVYNPPNPLVNDTVNFQSLSLNYSSLLWNFDDPSSGANNTSMLSNPIHQFSTPGIYQVQLIAFNGSLSDTLTLPVDVSGLPVSVSGNNLSDIPSVVYPNPFTRSIDVLNGKNNYTYKLYNNMGFEIWSGIEINKQDFSSLSSGIYYVVVFEDFKKHNIHKIIKY